MKDARIREIIARVYWQAHSDGSVRGKSGEINFGIAAVTIEAAAIELGCKPTKMKRIKKTELHKLMSKARKK